MEPSNAGVVDEEEKKDKTESNESVNAMSDNEPPTEVAKYDPKEHLTPIGVLFHFFVPNDQPLVIDGIEALPLEQQLSILNPINIHNEDTRNTLIRKLCEQLPNLKKSADKMDRFRNILKLFYEEQYIASILPFTRCSKQQIIVSLFCFFMHRLRRKPEGEDDEKRFGKEMESAEEIWEIVHNGIDDEQTEVDLKKGLIEGYNEIFENGIEKVLKECEMDDEDFDIEMLFPLWFIYRSLNYQHIITALQHENGALSQVLKSVSAEIVNIGSFNEEDVKRETMKKLRERKLAFSEIQYIENIWERSREREWNKSAMYSSVNQQIIT